MGRKRKNDTKPQQQFKESKAKPNIEIQNNKKEKMVYSILGTIALLLRNEIISTVEIDRYKRSENSTHKFLPCKMLSKNNEEIDMNGDEFEKILNHFTEKNSPYKFQRYPTNKTKSEKKRKKEGRIFFYLQDNEKKKMELENSLFKQGKEIYDSLPNLERGKTCRLSFIDETFVIDCEENVEEQQNEIVDEIKIEEIEEKIILIDQIKIEEDEEENICQLSKIDEISIDKTTVINKKENEEITEEVEDKVSYCQNILQLRPSMFVQTGERSELEIKVECKEEEELSTQLNSFVFTCYSSDQSVSSNSFDNENIGINSFISGINDY